MNISELLISNNNNNNFSNEPIQDSDLMMLWERTLLNTGFNMKSCNERNTLTDNILIPTVKSRFIQQDIPIHIKVIGRHLNGSFRCHIGTSKASRPIRSTELNQQMRLLAVFFRTENAKSQLISPDFIFFPTWLLHLFRYTQHGTTPGRTDVRFLENANMAKEDHIYRLNHVLNSMFRFNFHKFDSNKLTHVIELTNFLFDVAGLDYPNLPRPVFSAERSQFAHLSSQPTLYATLMLLLHSPRPAKLKPMCLNCNTKFASRRRLCVACYRYELKHGEARPLRLIVANRPGPKLIEKSDCDDPKSLPVVFYAPKTPINNEPHYHKKSCANCSVQETHQWYRNLCGSGHWCETCKSYYLRHNKVRPPELFIKAAKRKVDVRSLVNWTNWSWDDIPFESVQAELLSSVPPIHSPSSLSSSSSFSQPTTPPTEYSTNDSLYKGRSSAFYLCNFQFRDKHGAHNLTGNVGVKGLLLLSKDIIMKFIIFFGLVAFIASCYAACDCAASDQTCLDKCVTSANSCVVKCQKNNAGETCEQACFVANWPSMTTGQKDMLASKTSMNSMSATSAATATPVSIMTASIPASLRTTASVARPSAGATSTPKPTVNNNSVSSAENAVSFSWITFTAVAIVISLYLL